MNYLLLIACAMTCLSCIRQSPQSREAYRVIGLYNKQIEGKDRFEFFGGNGALMEDVSELDMAYVVHQPMNVSEARKILVDRVEGFLAFVNHDAGIRRYLNHYPFTANDIQFHLGFRDDQGKPYGHGSLSWAYLKEGSITYSAYNAYTGRDDIILEEKYDKAARSSRAL